jgi:hypothetical protein
VGSNSTVGTWERRRERMATGSRAYRIHSGEPAGESEGGGAAPLRRKKV